MPPDMTFEQFAALVANGFKPELVEPIAENLRRLIVERMAAALELAQYGEDGADGEEVLPTFKADYNSEIGIFLSEFPCLMVIPLGGDSTAEQLLTQKHGIHVQIDIARNIGAAGATAASNQLTKDLHVYARALVCILLNLKAEELIEGMSNAGGVAWDVTDPDYGLFNKNKAGTMYRRSMSVTVEVAVEER